MILNIICILIVLLAVLTTIKKGIFGDCLMVLLIFSFLVIIINFTISSIMTSLFGNMTENVKFNIYSLGNKTEIEGRFMVGCGHINSKEVYYMFTKDKNDMYSRFSIDTNTTKICEKENVTPHVKVRIKELPDNLKLFFNSMAPKTQYIIYVPPGTIIKRFEVK